jgi:hypothetical protein
VSTDVSEEHIASIFRVDKNKFSKKPALKLNVLHGVISQKIVLFTTTAVRTSNPV